MLVHRETRDIVVGIGHQIRAFREGGHVQAREVIGVVQAFATALSNGFNGRHRTRMQGQRQIQSGGCGLTGVVVGCATDAASHKSGDAIGKAAL